MSGQEFWIATATDPEGDLHWQELLIGDMTRQEAVREFREAMPRFDARCTLEVFGPFDTSKPAKTPDPFAYDGAAHIFNWARNSQEHYQRMRGLRPENFIGEAGRAAAASNLAWLAYRDALRLGDISGEDISATDILRAAIMFLEWDGES